MLIGLSAASLTAAAVFGCRRSLTPTPETSHAMAPDDAFAPFRQPLRTERDGLRVDYGQDSG